MSAPLRYSAFTDDPSGGNPASVEAAGVAATLTSVAPYVEGAPDTLRDSALQALGYGAEDLDPQLPPRIGYAGVRHLIIGVDTRARLARLEYDFEGLQRLMLNH